MKNNFTILLLLFVSLNSFGQQIIDSAFAFQSDSAKKYSLYVPSNYDENEDNAAMLALHPLNTNRWDAESWRDTLIQFAESNDIILICPDGGIDGRVDDPIDTAFTTVLLDSVQQWYHIDDNEIFVMGFSWGGKTAYTYGLRRKDKFRGFLIIGPAITFSEVSGIIDNAFKEAFFLIHGSNDSPAIRYTPFVDTLSNLNTCLETRFLDGVGHTIDFPNRNQILTDGLNYLKSENCGLSSTRNLPTSAINIYPNPSNGRIILDDVNLRDFSISLTDVNGKKIDFVINNNTLQVKHKFAGFAYLELRNTSERKFAKILIQ